MSACAVIGMPSSVHAFRSRSLVVIRISLGIEYTHRGYHVKHGSETEGEACSPETLRTARPSGEFGADAHVPHDARGELKSKADLRAHYC